MKLTIDNRTLAAFSKPYVGMLLLYLIARSDEAGEVRTSLRAIADDTAMGEWAVRNALAELGARRAVRTLATHHGTRITVCGTESRESERDNTARQPQATRAQKANGAGKGAYSFDEFWDLYGKRQGSKRRVREKWARLTDGERGEVFRHVAYEKAFVLPQYRRLPETYLNQRAWENDVIAEGGYVIRRGAATIADIRRFKEWFNGEVKGTPIPQIDEIDDLRRINVNICYTLYKEYMAAALKAAVREARTRREGGFVPTFDYIYNPRNIMGIVEKGRRGEPPPEAAAAPPA